MLPANERNIIKWHYVTDKEDKPTGLRGWDARLEQRYELDYTPDGYQVVIVEQIGEFDGISDWNNVRYRHVCTGTLFGCMVAAEKEADDLHAYEMQQSTREGEDVVNAEGEG